MYVKPKKHLGQHFLHDQNVCERIAASVSTGKNLDVLEIGPGTGALTKKMIPLFPHMKVVDIDTESIVYLKENKVLPAENIVEGDFLQMDLHAFFGGKEFIVAGNFPYNISSQILFRIFENRQLVPEMVGMFQKEVAQRIVSGNGNKDYGILSVLIQAYYEARYLFTVNEGAFNPPPKVKSGVIQLVRKENLVIDYDETLFVRLVKAAFNQRRKTLRNSLSGIVPKTRPIPYESLRPEQLTVADFIELTRQVGKMR